MSNYIFLTIPGPPIPKPAYKRGKGGNSYAPKSREAKMVSLFANSLYDGKILNEPLILFCEFFFPIPTGWTKGEQEKARTGIIYPISKKADSSNYLKFYEDALSKVIYEDDKLNVWASGSKFYAKNNRDLRTEIHILPFSMASYEEIKKLLFRTS
jgi:Holliday junction resolvase RusA-like endonuclease